jgi:predicted nuclease of predicted toxin-antitoxin system
VIRLLVDENLPATLAAKLALPCMHATELGEQCTDDSLWRFARQNGCIILTKDADFFERLALEGPPPKVVWVRTGNLRRSELDDLLAGQMPSILGLIAQSDLVEVHHDRLESFKF